jgi:hypothetical protein
MTPEVIGRYDATALGLPVERDEQVRRPRHCDYSAECVLREHLLRFSRPQSTLGVKRPTGHVKSPTGQLPASMAATLAVASGPQKSWRSTPPAASRVSTRCLRSPEETWL